jgi:hypothetical protein
MTEVDELAARLAAARPDLRDKLVAEVPGLAEPRLRFRRICYRNASWAFFLAVFNLVLATSDQYGLWWLSALSVGLMTWLMCWAEGRARAMTRQLHRLAAEQVARDFYGVLD